MDGFPPLNILNFPAPALLFNNNPLLNFLKNGVDIRYVQKLLGHNSLKTTEIYTHIADISKSSIKSPLDSL